MVRDYYHMEQHHNDILNELSVILNLQQLLAVDFEDG